MIERLLAADAALERGELDVAERLFRQIAEADPRNAIALVGLARLAIRNGDREAASERLQRALEIDPDEAAAQLLVAELASGLPVEAPAPAPTAVSAAAAGPEDVPKGEPPPRPSLLARILRLLGLRRG